MQSKIVRLGSVGVDSGRLTICDPSYIASQYQNPPKNLADYAHHVYRDSKSGSLWQYCYDGTPTVPDVNSIPGDYSAIIPAYGKSANDLIKEGVFVKTDIDPRPHIPDGEFSYRGISKITDNENHGGQLNYILGHEGVAVAFRSGLGDGHYDVYGEMVDAGDWGLRLKKVWVELITDEELEQLREAKLRKELIGL